MKSTLSLIAALIGLSLAFNSCTDESIASDSDPITQSVDSGEMHHENRLMMRNIDQADLDRPFIDDFDAFLSKHSDKKEKMEEKRSKMKEKMEEKLNLTDEQKSQLQALREESKNCSISSRDKIKTIMEGIFAEANKDREEIKSQLNNGSISKDEAKSKMNSLKVEVKEEIKSNSELVALKEEIKSCHEANKEKVAEILTDEQIEILKEMKEKHHGGNKGKERKHGKRMKY